MVSGIPAASTPLPGSAAIRWNPLFWAIDWPTPGPQSPLRAASSTIGHAGSGLSVGCSPLPRIDALNSSNQPLTSSNTDGGFSRRCRCARSAWKLSRSLDALDPDDLRGLYAAAIAD